MSEGQSRLRLQGGRAGWCLFGSVLTPHQSQSAQRLSPGEGTFAFLATGCDQATDIDLEVDDDRGEVVVQDIDPDPTPMGIAVTKANRTYNVTTSLLASRGAALTITGILRIEPAPNAASRRHMFSTLD
jgi:hypothetical protein